VSVILRTIRPFEDAFPVKHSLEPISEIAGIVGIAHGPQALGKERMDVDFPLVVSSVGVVDEGLLLWVLLDGCCELPLLGFGVVDGEFAVGRFSQEGLALEFKFSVMVVYLSFSADPPLDHFSLVGDFVLGVDEFALPVLIMIEGPLVDVFVGHHLDPLALPGAIFPLSKVVLFLIFVLHPGLSFFQLLEA
jgi:hypothetical protein